MNYCFAIEKEKAFRICSVWTMESRSRFCVAKTDESGLVLFHDVGDARTIALGEIHSSLPYTGLRIAISIRPCSSPIERSKYCVKFQICYCE